MEERYGEVAISREDHVAVLEIDRPPHNHVTVELMRDLADALDAVDADPGLRVSVLFTAGKSFCAGADFVSRDGFEARHADPTRALYAQALRLFSIRKPLVVGVQGAAVGAGLGLALVGDFRVAAPEARFSANFVKLGFHPGFGLTHTLPRLIGTQRAGLMFLSGRRIRADEALAWSLVDQLEPLDTLRPATLALAREIAENAPLAVQATRKRLPTSSRRTSIAFTLAILLGLLSRFGFATHDLF